MPEYEVEIKLPRVTVTVEAEDPVEAGHLACSLAPDKIGAERLIEPGRLRVEAMERVDGTDEGIVVIGHCESCGGLCYVDGQERHNYRSDQEGVLVCKGCGGRP